MTKDGFALEACTRGLSTESRGEERLEGGEEGESSPQCDPRALRLPCLFLGRSGRPPRGPPAPVGSSLWGEGQQAHLGVPATRMFCAGTLHGGLGLNKQKLPLQALLLSESSHAGSELGVGSFHFPE